MRRIRLAATMTVLVMTIVGFQGRADAAESLTIRGSVSCGSGPVVGVWVESSSGGSGFAGKTLYAGNNMARYSVTITVNLPTNIYLDVGCGGTEQNWATSNRTPTKAVNTGPGLYLNTSCNSPGSCSFYPRLSSPPAPVNNPVADSSQCTYRAADFWKLITGKFPNWGGDAYAWDDNAASLGWTVGSWPRPDSLVVWQQNMTSGGLGHVGYVADVRLNSGVVQIKVYDKNWDGHGGLRQGVWTNYLQGMRFILSSPRMGDLR